MENLVPVSKFLVVVWWTIVGTGMPPMKAYEASVRSPAECGEAVALIAEDFVIEGSGHDRKVWAVCEVGVTMIEERRG